MLNVVAGEEDIAIVAEFCAVEMTNESVEDNKSSSRGSNN